MKTLYYRPKKISKSVLISLATLAIAVMIAIECFPVKKYDGYESVKREAAQKADAAISVIGEKRTELNHPWIEQLDPARTMLIGPSMSNVTTQVGHLDAKQTSINPNFAAVVVEMLVEAGVKKSDRVALGCTGSFPGLDIAAYTAIEAMDLRPTIISSATSSQYGANHPDLMWPDMEKLLFDRGLIQNRSIATSIGGVGDRGVGMSDESIALLLEVIRRNEVPLLRTDSLASAVEERMRLYDEAAANEPYAAYINIGGGSASIRGTKGNSILGNGVIKPKNADISGIKDCAALLFLKRGVPVVNLINANELAQAHGLALAPKTRVPVGEGDVFGRTVYRRGWAVLGIALILSAAWLVMHPIPALERLFSRFFIRKQAAPSGQLMV